MTPANVSPTHDKSYQVWSKTRPREASHPHVNVLIVDDDRDSIKPLEKLLRSYGCSVYFVESGLQAIDFLSRDDEINLIFLDWNMPELEGGETISLTEKSIAEDSIAQETWFDRNMPVVTYTSEKRHLMRLPAAPHFAFVDHWPKSMSFNELALQVQSILAYVTNKDH